MTFQKGRIPWNKGKTGLQVGWNKGKKGLYSASDETKIKLCLARKGRTPNLGKHHSEETKLKMSLSRMGNTNCLGNHLSEEHKRNIGLAGLGRTFTMPEEAKLKMSLAKIGKYDGENNPRWKGGRLKHAQGYILIYKPAHPQATKHGYVFEHRLIMEKHLGRYLLPKEVVHHEGKKDDNRIEKLILFENNSKHKKYHDELKRKNLTNDNICFNMAV